MEREVEREGGMAGWVGGIIGRKWERKTMRGMRENEFLNGENVKKKRNNVSRS